jgi:hypothetical protein
MVLMGYHVWGCYLLLFMAVTLDSIEEMLELSSKYTHFKQTELKHDTPLYEFSMY